MFDTTTQSNSIQILFGLLKDISPALDSDEIDAYTREGIVHPAIFGDIFCKYVTIILNIDKYEFFDIDIEDETLSAHDKLLILHLRARWLISTEKFDLALSVLRNVVDSETVPDRLLLFLACSDMEVCCRETDDYKGAYEASRNKLDLLEHMLAEE